MSIFSVDLFSHQDDADVASAKTEFDQLYRDALGGFDDMQDFDDLEGRKLSKYDLKIL